MNVRKQVDNLLILFLFVVLAGCGSRANDVSPTAVASPTPKVSSDCHSGLPLTAVNNIAGLSSYVVHNWDYIERSEGAPRELYQEEVLSVVLKDGEVANTDSLITIYMDEFHRADYVRVGGDTFVRHNEGAWESIPAARDWSVTFDGVMGDTPEGFYNVLYFAENAGHTDCKTTEFEYNGGIAWRLDFRNIPQGVLASGVGGRRPGVDSYQEVQSRLINDGWTFQSADYSVTITDPMGTPRLAGESLRTRIGDGSGNNLYTTWETEWSNFNEPVTIRQP